MDLLLSSLDDTEDDAYLLEISNTALRMLENLFIINITGTMQG